jgi:hypothetical protein
MQSQIHRGDGRRVVCLLAASAEMLGCVCKFGYQPMMMQVELYSADADEGRLLGLDNAKHFDDRLPLPDPGPCLTQTNSCVYTQ